jgi:hypothetical protein
MDRDLRRVMDDPPRRHEVALGRTVDVVPIPQSMFTYPNTNLEVERVGEETDRGFDVKYAQEWRDVTQLRHGRLQGSMQSDTNAGKFLAAD